MPQNYAGTIYLSFGKKKNIARKSVIVKIKTCFYYHWAGDRIF